jgi:RNA polymerase sigma factor (sigma-70 family)
VTWKVGGDVNVEPGFEELYEREFAPVFRAAFLLCGDRSTAEDATQEAFARALARWRRLDGQPWAAGWVMTTAMNAARRAMRRRPTPTEEPRSTATDHEARLDVRAAIERLPARQQETVALHYLLDLSVADTASAMGVAEGTVKAHLSRARESLGGSLGAVDDETEDRSSKDHRSRTGSKRRTNDA